MKICLLSTVFLSTLLVAPIQAGFETDIVLKATSEYNTYKNLNECSSVAMRNRIGQYWANLTVSGRDGCTDPRDSFPWSAAFVSFMVRLAGGGDKFAYSEAHHTYIRNAFNGGKGLYNSALDIASETPETGDLVCVGRESAATWTYNDFKTWAANPSSGGVPTHCDIVVQVTESTTGTTIGAVGGNLGDQVKQTTGPKGNYKVLLKVTRDESNDRLVDIGIIVDVSGSFEDDLANFRNEATTIVSLVQASYPNALFGLATFQDYPLPFWGESGDVPHALVQNLGPRDRFIAAVNSISAAGGGDTPESQLVSLYQSITGKGQIVPAGVGGGSGYTIPPNLNFSFRKGSARVLLLWTDASFHTPNTTVGYPGPSFADVVEAATTGLSDGSRRRHLESDDNDAPRSLQVALGADAVRILGIVSQTTPSQLPQLAQLAKATGAVAGATGLDCDNDGTIDIPAGEPIVCPVGAGLTAAIVKVVQEIVPAIPNDTGKDDECGCGRFGVQFLGVRLFCPKTRCGLFGTLFDLCKCD